MKEEREEAPFKHISIIHFVFTAQCANSLAFAAVEVEDSVQSALDATVVNCGCLFLCYGPLLTDQKGGLEDRGSVVPLPSGAALPGS